MKKNVLVVIALLLAFANIGSAQQMNFQGKIFYLGAPVNNPTGHLSFFINGLTSGWTWTELDTVVINNGLYSLSVGKNTPMPMNLFDSTNSSRKMVVYYEGNIMDTLTLFAPFERDPNIPRYIRDSITWANVHNKPTIDTSFTNEIQTLSIGHDTLSISSGNFVIIPSLSDTFGSKVINGNFTVIDSSITHMISVPTGGSTFTYPPDINVWQSFKSSGNGKLRAIKLYLGAGAGPGVTTVTVGIYDGQGSFAFSLSGTPVTISGVSSAPGMQTLDLTSAGVQLTSGHTYTFKIAPYSGQQLTVQLQPNPYPYGIEGTYNSATLVPTLNPLTDLTFSVDIDNSTPACLTFGDNCYVGIGIDTPRSQLEVRGRIRDLTGPVMPVGSIISYGGRKIPEGWLLCDGHAVSRINYSDLFDAIDTSWGHGDGSLTFNVPDLGGRFLRGMDSTQTSGGNDPEHTSRTAGGGVNGGNTGNNIGSLQGDQFSSHHHNVTGSTIWTNSVPAAIFNLVNPDYVSFTQSTSNSGGTETRPKNASVYFIIKY